MCGDSLASIFTEKSPSARNRWLHPHHSQSIKQRLAAFALTAIVSGLKFIGFLVRFFSRFLFRVFPLTYQVLTVNPKTGK